VRVPACIFEFAALSLGKVAPNFWVSAELAALRQSSTLLKVYPHFSGCVREFKNTGRHSLAEPNQSEDKTEVICYNNLSYAKNFP
jgi:hypothetical protein